MTVLWNCYQRGKLPPGTATDNSMSLCTSLGSYADSNVYLQSKLPPYMYMSKIINNNFKFETFPVSQHNWKLSRE